MLRSLLLLLALLVGLAQPAANAQQPDPPQVLGTFVGATASFPQTGLELYAGDLGWTFEHQGKITVLLGDTWATSAAPCEPFPLNDDSQASLPLGWDESQSALPPLLFETQPGDPNQFAPIRVVRNGNSLPMGYGRTPLTGFSDGTDAIGLFGRSSYVTCGAGGTCPEGLTCTANVGRCFVLDPSTQIQDLCQLGVPSTCPLAFTCQSTPNGMCMDPTSSQYLGTLASEPFAVAHRIEIAVQDANDPVLYDHSAVLPTNKFSNSTARSVAFFSGATTGSDYSVGPDTLFVWGRPWFVAEGGRQAQLYLLMHSLPIPRDGSDNLDFDPLYFSGVSPGTNEPLWSTAQLDAVPLAQDGVVDGDPFEERMIVDQMAVSWVGAPVNKWVMLYGGDLPDELLLDPGGLTDDPPGAIMIRYADHPWGPWSPAAPHLLPGDPNVAGDPYGPGGFLYHNECVDQPGLACADSDPSRPFHLQNPGCTNPNEELDIGRMLAPSIIDAYTRYEPDGVTLYWHLSTWNPYGFTLLKTHFPVAPVPAVSHPLLALLAVLVALASSLGRSA